MSELVTDIRQLWQLFQLLPALQALPDVTSCWQLISMSTSLRYLIPSTKANSLNLQQVRQSVSEWVSQWVTDMGRLWSDLGPIKRRGEDGLSLEWTDRRTFIGSLGRTQTCDLPPTKLAIITQQLWGDEYDYYYPLLPGNCEVMNMTIISHYYSAILR